MSDTKQALVHLSDLRRAAASLHDLSIRNQRDRYPRPYQFVSPGRICYKCMLGSIKRDSISSCGDMMDQIYKMEAEVLHRERFGRIYDELHWKFTGTVVIDIEREEEADRLRREVETLRAENHRLREQMYGAPGPDNAPAIGGDRAQ